MSFITQVPPITLAPGAVVLVLVVFLLKLISSTTRWKNAPPGI
jgi:hypothetical protein